jgi:hypothetical protein
MKALCSSRTLVTLYQSAWINIPKDLNCQCSVGCVRYLPNLSNEIPSLVCWLYEACTLVLLSYYFIVITFCNWTSVPWRLYHIQLQCFTKLFILYSVFSIYEICSTFLLQCLCIPVCCDCEMKILENRENGYCREVKSSLCFPLMWCVQIIIFANRGKKKFS